MKTNFNLEKAKQGAELINRRGHDATVVCWDYNQIHKAHRLLYIATRPDGSQYCSAVYASTGLSDSNRDLDLLLKQKTISRWLIYNTATCASMMFTDREEAEAYIAKTGNPTEWEIEEKSVNVNPEVLSVDDAKRYKNKSNGAKKPVRDTDTGHVYESGEAAAKMTGVSPASVSVSARNGARICGKKFEFINS